MRISERFQQTLRTAIADNAIRLPTLPAVAARIGAAASDENVSAASIATELEADPALAARIIRVANSALYRTCGRVDRLRLAVARIGIPTTRRLVLALSLQQALKSSHPVIAARIRSNWTRSTEIAAMCRVLAAHCSKLNADEAMLAGLVHRIGVLPVLAMAEQLPQIVTHPAVLDATIGAWHARLGAILLQAWQFPPEIIAVPANAQDVLRAHDGPADLSDVVTVARLESQSAAGKLPGGFDPARVPAYAKLGVETVTLGGFGDEVAEARGLLN